MALRLPPKVRSVLPPFVLLGILCVMFYWDALWLPGDRILGGNDLANMFYHWLRFAAESVRHGQFPLWNPYLFAGLPFVANPQPALFYPPTWLALALPITQALSIMIVFHIWLAGAGMFLWLRAEGATSAGATIGAIAFAFSGYFFVRVRSGHLGVIATVAWLPLLLWAIQRAICRRSYRLALIAGLPFGFSILAGHTASLIYVFLALVAYSLYHVWLGWRGAGRLSRTQLLPLGALSIMALTGFAVAAVQLLPLTELAARSTREASPSYEFASTLSWPPGYLLTLLVPTFFGEPVQTGYWGDGIYDEFVFYAGILPLLLLLLSLSMRHRLIPFLAALALAGILIAFGKHGILHLLFCRFVPGFQLTRAPSRAGFWFTVATSAATGLAISTLQVTTPAIRERMLRLFRWQPVLAIGGVTLVSIALCFATYALGRENNPAVGRLWHLANGLALFFVFFTLSAGLLMWWRRVPYLRATALVLGGVLVLTDLWTFGNRIVTVVPLQPSAYWATVARAVPDPQAARVLPWGLHDFEQNNGMPFGLRSIFGYDPLILQRFEEFVTSQPDPRARTYDLLNAGYLIAPGPQDFPDEPDAPRLVLQEEGVWVYERPTALPRAWIVQEIEPIRESHRILQRIHDTDFDPRRTALVEAPLTCPETEPGTPSEVEVEQYGINRIEARVRGGGGLLIFSEIYYPGWRAFVDGRTVRLVQANYILRALCVPRGEHHVTLVYDPPSLKIGIIVTSLSLATIGWVALWPALARQRSAREHQSSGAVRS